MATKVGCQRGALLHFLKGLYKTEEYGKDAFPTHSTLLRQIERIEK